MAARTLASRDYFDEISFYCLLKYYLFVRYGDKSFANENHLKNKTFDFIFQFLSIIYKIYA